MTSNRSQAYGRVMQTLAELGPTKLHEDEVDRLRDAADTLLFTEDMADDAAQTAVRDARGVIDNLVAWPTTWPRAAHSLPSADPGSIRGCRSPRSAEPQHAAPSAAREAQAPP